MLLIGGTRDPIVAPGMLRALFADLRQRNKNVSLRFFPGGHVLSTTGVVDAIVAWFAMHCLDLKR